MSKKIYVLGYQPDPAGPAFSRVRKATDFQKSQDYAHAHINQVTKDLLMAGATGAQVSGFQATLTSGRSISIAHGNVYDQVGLEYDSPDDASIVTMAAADTALARIDTVFATLEIDALALNEFRPFRQLLTPAQVAAGVMPQTNQYNQPTEIQTRATVAVRTGTPSANPTAPAVNANEVALYRVRVAAGQTTLASVDVTDVRPLTRSLQQAFASIDTINANLAETIDDRVAALVRAGNNTGILIVYDDAANTLTFSGIPASASVPGTMSAADKTKLDAATASNTPSTLMLRDANGDFSARDHTVARRINYSDGTVRYSAGRVEEQIVLMEGETGFATRMGGYESLSTMAIVTRGTSGIPYYVNLQVEDFLNLPLCWEIVAAKTLGGNGGRVALANVTNGVLISSANTTNNVAGAVLARSPVFYLIGSGRKRFQVAAGQEFNDGTSNEVRVYAARIIINPQYSNCGGNGQSACPV